MKRVFHAAFFAMHLLLAAGLYAWADWHRNAAIRSDRKARGLW